MAENRDLMLATDTETEVPSTSGWKRKLPLLGALAGCALMGVVVAMRPHSGKATSMSHGLLSFAEKGTCDEPGCKAGDDSAKKQRPLCKDGRRLEDKDTVAKLEQFFEGGEVLQEPGGTSAKITFASPAMKNEMATLHTFNRQPVVGPAGSSAMHSFVSDEACIDVRPVLTVTTPFTLSDTAESMPMEFFLPMFIRAYTSSIVDAMEVNEKAVSVRLVAGARRLSSEDVIPASIGKEFKIVGEVTDPMPFVIQGIERPAFAGKFRQSVEDKLNQQGAKEGMGSFRGIATFGAVQVVESNTNTIEGSFQSMGYGTACRKDKDDHTTTGEGHVEVKQTNSLRHCSQICDTRGEGCHGFEFNHAESRCEIWKVPICYGEESALNHGLDTFECFKKCL